MVLSVIPSSILLVSILSVSSSISTNFGTNPAARTAFAVAQKVVAGIIISSPRFAPNS